MAFLNKSIKFALYSSPVLFTGVLYDFVYSINPNIFCSYDKNTDRILVEIKNDHFSCSTGKLDVSKNNIECLESKGFYINCYDTSNTFTNRVGPKLFFGYIDDELQTKSGPEAYSKFMNSCKECNMYTYVEYVDQYGIKRSKKLFW